MRAPRPFKRRLLRRARRLGAAALAAGAAAALVLGILFLLFPFPTARLAEARGMDAALVLDREGGLVAWRVDAAERWRLPVRLDQLSPWVIRATVAAEDKRFWSHGGVDVRAALRAARQNLAGRRRVSGASTITMQSIRLLRPRARTYSTKCVEAFRALEIEGLASKEEILELYLGLAPYGGNVVGIEAAARRYFGVRAADLTLAEAALLAGVPQRPARFNPRKHLAAALRRRAYVLERMRALGLATGEEIRIAERAPMTLAPTAGASPAPRFADYVLERRRSQGGVIRTTLDPEIQEATREAAARHVEALPGVDGAAAVVLDVASSSLVAMVGSIDPHDPQTGFVNAAAVPRQPGSLLKPFIYAAAFETGTLTPGRLVYDVPVTWRGYRPRNMDRQHFGPMPASRALVLSRNVPAVRLLDRVGPDRLARDLKRLGLDVTAAEERCGLSLALGTAEVRLVEIANAYAALARLGAWRPLRVLEGEERAQAVPVYSPGAAWLLLRALDADGSTGRAEASAPVWKTGTSWQHRDAWAVAMTPRHVVAVWRGRLSGREHPALIGARAALPLALEIIGRIAGRDAGGWPRPEAVRTRRVCSLSGAPSGGACPQTADGEYLPGKSGEAPCTIHRFERDRGGRRVVTLWPDDVAALLSTEHEDAKARSRPSLCILSPADGAEYYLPQASGTAGRDEPPSGTMHFRTGPTASTGTVFWFLDGELFAEARAGEAVRWPMRPGKHELVVADGRGTSAQVRFRVAPPGP